MKMGVVSLILLLGVACGGPGVGDPCTTVGDREECGDDAVCQVEGDQTICLAICEDDDECASGEVCSGTSGSSLKACRLDDP